MMKKRCVFQVIVATFILVAGYSCQEDKAFDAGPYDYDDASLNMTGKAFMQTVQSIPRWEEEWEAAKRIGTPQPNEVFNVYSPGHGAYTVVPIVREGEVTHVAFYPLQEGGEPLIVGSDAEAYPDYVRGFFQARCYATWEESELKVNRDLKLFVYNDSTVQATPMASDFPNYFPADIWVSFTYDYTDTWTNYYERNSEIYRSLEISLREVGLRMRNVEYNFPGSIYTVDLHVYNVSSYSEANNTAIEFYDYAIHCMYLLGYVERAWAIYQWREPIGSEGGGNSGSFGGSPPETEEPEEGKDEGERCPYCNAPIEDCTCIISFVIKVPQGKILELRDEYDIIVHVGGEMKDDIEMIIIEMKRKQGADKWICVASGKPANYQYSTRMAAFSPGGWDIRVGYQTRYSAQIGYATSTEEIGVLCPSVNDFKSNTTVVNFLKGLWDKSVAFARENQATHAVREFGAFILLHPDGSYSCKEVDPGPIVYATEEGVHGSISANKEGIADESEWYHPTQRNPIIVGFMHTHYPSTWVPTDLRRDVGPSDQDNSSDHTWPGLVYDYSNSIQGGAPVNDPNNPLKIWTCGPERRVIQ